PARRHPAAAAGSGSRLPGPWARRRSSAATATSRSSACRRGDSCCGIRLGCGGVWSDYNAACPGRRRAARLPRCRALTFESSVPARANGSPQCNRIAQAQAKPPRGREKQTMAARRQAVGVIGLGSMGLGVARTLLGKGFEVHAYDVRPAVLKAFARQGGIAAKSPAEVGRHAPVVIILVVNAEQTDEVLFGKNGAATTLGRG